MENKRKIGVIGAMKPETELLQKQMRDVNITKKAGMEFHEGKIGATDVVVVQSGIGKINAAVCAEILINSFGVTHLINTGIAGSLRDEIHVLDIVVAEDAVHHDFDIINFGYPYGEVPGIGRQSFPADEELRSDILQALKETAPEAHVFTGRVASGDQFIRTDEKKQWIRSTFDASCAEMEGAAIAHTAYINSIPFAIVRLISDNADDDAAMTYEEIETKAAHLSAEMLFKVLEKLS
ncbi:MAG: 5'-methylthioadenosine/adenosylhomocysteine nucleosidase [Solobacterium sp.]|nr:5'-methylthioadenosine/adenosylhomocysteine nucleosidase [Solobacterium sp.]